MRPLRIVLAALVAVLAAPIRATAQTQPPRALDVALVVRVDGPPLLGPDGQPSSTGAASLKPLEASLRSIASLRVPFALSVSPVWVDELIAADQTGTFAALLSLATHHPLLHTPYARVRLPDEGGPAAVARELSRGELALQRSLQTATQRILDPPDLALSDDVVAGTRAAGLTAALAPISVVGDHPVSYHGLTLIPVAAQASTSPAEIYGASGSMVVIADAGDALAGTVQRLAADPRIRLVNITDLTAGGRSAAVSFGSVSPPPASYRQAIRRARDAVNGFASYTLAGNQTAHLLDVLLARAASTADWQGDWSSGTTRAATLVDLARAGESLISAADGSVTLTSRRGAVPVTLENRAAYPVRVHVRVTSPKLTFPSGDERLVTISPHGVTITFVAEARSTGSFPMDVSL
jgi:hypothetical protein